MPRIQSNGPIGTPSSDHAKKVITTPETTPKHKKVVTTEKSTAPKAEKAGKGSNITPKTITEMTVSPGSGAAPVVKGGVRTAGVSFDKAVKNIQDATADWETKTNSGYIPVGGYIEDGYAPKKDRIDSILAAATADADHEAWQVRVDLLWALDKAWSKGFLKKTDIEDLVWKMHNKEKDWRSHYNSSRLLIKFGYDVERVEIPRIANPEPLQRHTGFRADDKPIVPVVEQPKLEQQRKLDSEYVEHLEVINEKLEVNAREYEYQLEAQKSELDKLKRDLEGKDVEQRKLQEQIRNFQQNAAQVQESIQKQQNERAQLNQEIKQLNQEKKAAEEKVIEIEGKLAKEADKTARKDATLEGLKAARKRNQDRISHLIKENRQAKAINLEHGKQLEKLKSELDKRGVQLSELESEKLKLHKAINIIEEKINQKNAEIDEQKQSIAKLGSQSIEVQTAKDKLEAENKTLEQKIQEVTQANDAKIAKLERQLKEEQEAMDQEVDAYNEIVKKLNSEIKTDQEEIEEIMGERRTFEQKFKASEAKVVQLTEEFDNKLKEGLEAQSKLQQQIDALKAENQTVNAQLAQVQQNAQTQQQETAGTLNAAQQEIERLKGQLRQLQEQANQATANLQKQKTNYDDQIKKLNVDHAITLNQVSDEASDQLQEQEANYDNQINQLNTEHAITLSQIAGQAVAELQAQKTDYDNRISQLNTAHATTLKEVNQQLQAAVQLNTQNQTRIQDLTIELENNQAELQLVTGIRDNLNKELADTQARLKDDEAKIVELKVHAAERIAQSNKTIDSLRIELNSLNSQATENKLLNESLNRANETLNAEVDKLISQTDSLNAQLNTKVAQLDANTKDYETKVVEFTHRIRDLEHQNSELNGDIEYLILNLNSSIEEIRKLRQKNAQLEKDAEVARTKLESQDKQIARLKEKRITSKDMVKTTAPIAPMSAIEVFNRYQDNINSIQDIIACFTAFPQKDLLSPMYATMIMQKDVKTYIQNNSPLKSEDIEALVKCFCDSIDKINEVNFTLATFRVFDTLEKETAISDGAKNLIKKYKELHEPATVPLQGAQRVQLPQLTYPEKKKPAKVLFSLKNIKSKDSATRLAALEELNIIYKTAEVPLKTNIIKAMFGMLINDDDKNNTKQALLYITNKLGKTTTTKNEVHLFIRGLKKYAAAFPNVETSETAPILINDILPKFINSYKDMLQKENTNKYLDMLRTSLENLNRNAGDNATLEKIKALQDSLK